MIKRYDQTPLVGMTMVQFLITSLAAVILIQAAGIAEAPALTIFAAVLPAAGLISLLAFLPAVILLFWAQKFLFPGRVGLLMMSEVLIAVLTASLFLPEERLSSVEWAGAVLIVGACLIEVFLIPQSRSEAA